MWKRERKYVSRIKTPVSGEHTCKIADQRENVYSHMLSPTVTSTCKCAQQRRMDDGGRENSLNVNTDREREKERKKS